MTDTELSSARVVPEDAGTGLPTSEDSGDYLSAGDLGALSLQGASGDYVEAGFDLTYDSGSETVDIGSGMAYIRFEGGVTVQDNVSGSYEVGFNQPIVFAVTTPAVSGLGLDSNAVNDIWVAFNRSSSGGDGVFIRHGAGLAEPSDPVLKIGQIDTSDGTVDEKNRDPDRTYEGLEFQTLTDSNGYTIQDLNRLGGSVSQSGTSVLDNPADLNFVGGTKASISVADDGDDTTTITVNSSTVDVENTDGASIVTNTSAIQAGVGLSFVDDTDSTATLETTASGTSHSSTSTASDYTASDGDLVLVDASGGPVTVTLPSPSDGQVVDVKKTDTSENPVTIATPNTETIDGQSSHSFSGDYVSRTIACDGTNYYIV
jgi:hypothetical protein